LEESGLSRKYWTECLAALIHVLNRCPTSAVEGKTPHEVWYKEKPGVGHLRVWGCLAYVHIQKDKCAKLGSHMEKCVFIGYPDGYKGWKFYNPETDKVIICEPADFDERYTYEGRLLIPKENIDLEPRPLISGIENDALPNDIATEFEVQEPGHAVEQPATDSDEEDEPVIDPPPRNPAPTIKDVEEEEEDNRPHQEKAT